MPTILEPVSPLRIAPSLATLPRPARCAAFVWIALASASAPLAAQAAPTLAEHLVEALAEHRVVALGENHGHVELHRLLLVALRDPAVAARIDDLVVEFGNARYQDVVDRYIGGAAVPDDSLALAWRNTVVSPNTVWESPVYRGFFEAVREINRSLEPPARYRVVLADSDVDWSAVRHRDDLAPYYDRASAMAGTLRRESLLRGRRSLFLAGGLHVARRPRVRVSSAGLPVAEPTPVVLIELHHPGVTWVVQSMGRAGELELEALTGSGPARVVRTDARPEIAGIEANLATTLRDRDGARSDVYGNARLPDVVDAVLLWDPGEVTLLEAPASAFADDAWWAELNRRSLLVRGVPMDERLRGG